jgi:hypothetical protein
MLEISNGRFRETGFKTYGLDDLLGDLDILHEK